MSSQNFYRVDYTFLGLTLTVLLKLVESRLIVETKKSSCIEIDGFFEQLDPLFSDLNGLGAEDEVATVGVSQSEDESGIFALVKISRFLKKKLSIFSDLKHFIKMGEFSEIMDQNKTRNSNLHAKIAKIISIIENWKNNL